MTPEPFGTTTVIRSRTWPSFGAAAPLEVQLGLIHTFRPVGVR